MNTERRGTLSKTPFPKDDRKLRAFAKCSSDHSDSVVRRLERRPSEPPSVKQRLYLRRAPWKELSPAEHFGHLLVKLFHFPEVTVRLFPIGIGGVKRDFRLTNFTALKAL